MSEATATCPAVMHAYILQLAQLLLRFNCTAAHTASGVQVLRVAAERCTVATC